MRARTRVCLRVFSVEFGRSRRETKGVPKFVYESREQAGNVATVKSFTRKLSAVPPPLPP